MTDKDKEPAKNEAELTRLSFGLDVESLMKIKSQQKNEAKLTHLSFDADVKHESDEVKEPAQNEAKLTHLSFDADVKRESDEDKEPAQNEAGATQTRGQTMRLEGENSHRPRGHEYHAERKKKKE